MNRFNLLSHKAFIYQLFKGESLPAIGNFNNVYSISVKQNSMFIFFDKNLKVELISLICFVKAKINITLHFTQN